MGQDSPFSLVASALEQLTDLDRLESRGTVRLALKSAGFDAKSVTPSQMRAIVERVLPDELRARGVADAESICVQVARAVSDDAPCANGDSPDSVFERIIADAK